MAGKAVSCKKVNKRLMSDTEDFINDLQYIIDGIDKKNALFTRCLSVIYLTNKCMLPEFGKYIKSIGTINKLLGALQDAAEYEMLGLFTAAAMFLLSQDLQEIDINKDFLNLLIKLLNTESNSTNKLSASQLLTLQENAKKLCPELLKLSCDVCPANENFTLQTQQFAIEILLVLPQQCYSAWFRDKLYHSGAVEHIVHSLHTKCLDLDSDLPEWSNILLKYLQFLVNVSQHQEMQNLLLTYNEGKVFGSLIKLCEVYGNAIPTHYGSSGVVPLNVLIASLKVLVALTHNYGNQNVDEFLKGYRLKFLDVCLNILFEVSNHAPKEMRFELILLVVILLTNFVEENIDNRKLLFESKLPTDVEASFFESTKISAVDALITLFYQQQYGNTKEINVTDAVEVLRSEKLRSDADVKLVEECHSIMMESLIAAHIAILLGYIIMHNKEYEEYVRQCMREESLKEIVFVLKAVLNLMYTTASILDNSNIIIHILRMIDYFEQIDRAE